MQAMQNRVELLRQQLQKEKDGVKKNKQLTKEAIQKKVDVNKINQWVPPSLSRKIKTTPRKSRGSMNSAGATRRSDSPTKKSFRISRRPYTWLSSMMPGSSSSSPTNTTAESSKCNGTS